MVPRGTPRGRLGYLGVPRRTKRFSGYFGVVPGVPRGVTGYFAGYSGAPRGAPGYRRYPGASRGTSGYGGVVPRGTPRGKGTRANTTVTATACASGRGNRAPAAYSEQMHMPSPFRTIPPIHSPPPPPPQPSPRHAPWGKHMQPHIPAPIRRRPAGPNLDPKMIYVLPARPVRTT
jgi:hypothetical protein